MDYLVPILGLASSLLGLISINLGASGFLRKEAMNGVKGEKFSGVAEIDVRKYNVQFVVGSDNLWLLSSFPSFGLVLDLDELKLSKKNSFIGHQVRIISHDVYTEHLFNEIIVSVRVSKKLEKISHGKLLCGSI
ncbi:hypothetical protein [Marisediminitalea aggregata]|nr:hypothetical protein [Marisediminitalea aggregata]